MKKPEQPWAPFKWDYEKEFDEEILLNKDFITNEDFDEAEYLDNWKDQNDWKEGEPLPDIASCYYHNYVCTLADLIAKAPKDVPHEFIEITMNRDRMIDYINVRVKAKRPTDKKALKAAYDKAYKEFQKKEAAYKEELKAFEEWQKQQEIKELEAKLAVLKK